MVKASLESLAKGKHSKVFSPNVSDEEKCYVKLTIGVNVIKLFFFARGSKTGYARNLALKNCF